MLLSWRKAHPWMIGKERGQNFRHYYPDLTEYFLQAGIAPMMKYRISKFNY
ncbi:MAG: hypothetical protein U7127_19900 [Phormidium sp.]